MGESFGPWRMGNDAELMRYISSANIACGYHAGDAGTMRETVELALRSGVEIGAHPGFQDLQGFGRRNMTLSPQEVFDVVLYQVSALKGICESGGGRLHHVKPHGALYNQAARDPETASAIAGAIMRLDPRLILYGLSGSSLISEAKKAGLKTASEVFADRRYENDGSLTPRSGTNAVITDTSEAAAQALGLVLEGSVTAVDGSRVAVAAETICIHGDGENAVAFARAVRGELGARGIAVVAPVQDNDG